MTTKLSDLVPNSVKTVFKKKTNLLIAIEGIDGVGKNTQATLLAKALKEEFGDCGFFSFPRYETPTGRRVREYLDGKHDTLNLLSRAKLYSDDRLAAREEILDLLYRGRNVVCDRYVASNLAFQVAIAQLEMPDTDYAYRVRDYIQGLEYSVNMLPIPDITFVLNVDVATSEKMVAERYKNTSTLKDKHEANTKLLELSHQIYRKMTSDAPETYLEIICNNEDGTIRSREDIHAEILSIVKNKQVPVSKGFFEIA